MKKKYKITLVIIFILIALTVLLCGGYYIYTKNVNKNNAEVIIDEELSINYFNGRKFIIEDEKKEIDFSIINDSEEQSMYHIILENINVSSNSINYSLYENDNEIVKNQELVKSQYLTISSFISITGNDAKSYKLIINNPNKEKITFDINIQKASKDDTNFSQLILNNNSINKDSKTNIGEEIAVVDEGLILDVDDNGNTYYFRGNITNNYVKFANLLWRIVKINGDGTIKIVLDSTINGSDIYDSQVSKERLKTLDKISNNKYNNVLSEWYNQNLKEYDKYISLSKYCIDINKEGENLSNYFRVNLSNTPTFNCLGRKNNSKIGLLTIDEIIYAGATINEPNEYFYLNNDDINESWWSMSPAKDGVEGTYYYEVSSNGTILTNSTGDVEKKLRPVINLNKNIEMIGTGTVEDPYVLK